MSSKPKFCDLCEYHENRKVEGGVFIDVCTLTMRRCCDERAPIFSDACGPKGLKYERAANEQ